MMTGEILQILMVEDDDDHAEIVVRGMANSSFESRIHRVSDGEAALDYVFRRGTYTDPALSPRPHVILLDLRLPVVDGIEVLRTIKEAPELRNIPVIIVTTSDAERDIASAYQNYANSYLVKPTEIRHINQLTDALSAYWLAWNRHPNERGGAGPKTGRAGG